MTLVRILLTRQKCIQNFGDINNFVRGYSCKNSAIKGYTANMNYQPVADFYTGKSVFITGSTGFIGKSLQHTRCSHDIFVAMASTVVKCNNCNVVINELLAFIQNKMDVMDNISLVLICNSAFSAQDIVIAKDLLFDSIKTSKRKIQRKKEGKEQRDLEDILSLMRQVDPDEIPIFVARNLSNLPPVTFDHIDVTRLLKDIVLLQQEVSAIKNNYINKEQLETVITDITNSKFEKENMNLFEDSFNFVDACENGSTQVNNMKDCLSLDTNTISLQNNELTATQNSLDKGPSTFQGSKYQKQLIDDNLVKNTRKCNQPFLTKPDISLSVNKGGNRNITIHPSNKTFAQIVSEKGEWNVKNNEEQWKTVQRKRYRNRIISSNGEANVEPEGKFKAADIKIPLFINKVHKETNSEDISSYIFKKTGVQIMLEKFKMWKEREYDAYKLFVPRQKLSIFLDARLWPNGITFRRFVYRRRGLPNTIQTQ